EGYRRFLSHLRSGKAGRTYSSRYIGSLVADFHRTLLKGGIFLYPPTKQHAGGKLRLMYEANPIAFLPARAGALAPDGMRPTLNTAPSDLPNRTPLFVGSKEEVNMWREMVIYPIPRVENPPPLPRPSTSVPPGLATPRPPPRSGASAR